MVTRYPCHSPAAGCSSSSGAPTGLGGATVLREAAMASGHRPLVVFFLSTLCFASSSPAAAAGKVSLALYYETLCPYCSNFIVNHLAEIFADGLISIVDLDLVPYGNARVDSNGSISCQHGPWECVLNTVEACAISAWPDVQEHFSFIYCVEHLVMEQKYAEWESCFEKTGLDPQAVLDCYNSGYGQKLELQYAAQTDALQPQRRFVPWVLVNGLPLYDDYENFKTYICKAYDGELPKACEGLPLAIETNRADRVCLVNEMTSSSATIKKHEVKMKMLT